DLTAVAVILYSFSLSRRPSSLPSFPTRRSSDLGVARAGSHIMLEHGDVFGPWVAGPDGCELYGFIAGEGAPFAGEQDEWQALLRSEEHTSELQSRFDLVCRLLLEKKNILLSFVK